MPPKKENPSVRAWAFTVNTIDTVEDAKNYKLKLDDSVMFVRYQLESAPSTGKLHLQGCIRMVSAARLKRIKEVVGEAHCSPARDWKELKAYCAKEESRHPANVKFEWGRDSGQGARLDLESIARSIVHEGQSTRDIALEHPGVFVRYHKGLRVLESIVRGPRTMPERRAILLWGDTGVGKTRMAYDLFDVKDIYMVFDVHTPWFDGYNGEKVVILDEMGPGAMGFNYLKRITDLHPIAVPVKQGSVSWLPEIVILTANTPIENWYPSARPADLDALKRRIKVFRLPEQQEEAARYVKDGTIALKKRDRSISPIRPESYEELVPPREPMSYGLQDIWNDLSHLHVDEAQPWIAIGSNGVGLSGASVGSMEV